MAEAILGRDAQEFLSTELGRYLVGRAELEEREALEKLSEVSAWRVLRVQELQAQVWRARSVRAWLAEIVQAGNAAEAAMEQENQ